MWGQCCECCLKAERSPCSADLPYQLQILGGDFEGAMEEDGAGFTNPAYQLNPSPSPQRISVIEDIMGRMDKEEGPGTDTRNHKPREHPGMALSLCTYVYSRGSMITVTQGTAMTHAWYVTSLLFPPT